MLMVQPLLDSPASTERAQEWQWVHSRDGQTELAHGRDVTALLPRDDDVVLVLPVLSVSWHRLSLPKINAARLRQALDGLLEDRLLVDPAQLHLALQPGLTPGQTGWVAACARAPLTQWLATLQAAGRPASRLVPDLCPQPQATLQALVCADQPWLVVAGPMGVVPTPLRQAEDEGMDASAHASTLSALPSVTPDTPRQSEPACASAAEHSLGQPFELRTTAQRLLASAQTDWNLAQFDLRLSAGARRGQRLGQTLRAMLHTPAWRPARWGVVVLVASLLLGLNGMAWQERRSLTAKRQQVSQLLTQTFPKVSLVLDAPLQMQQEVARLQRLAGEAGPHDLEPFLASFSATSQDSIDLSAIQYSPQNIQLTLTNPQRVTDASLQPLRDGLQRLGWRTQYASPVLTVQPQSSGARP